MKNHSTFDQMINLRFSLWTVKRMDRLCKTLSDLYCGTMAIPWTGINIFLVFSFIKELDTGKEQRKL